jgi:predicted SprT family Zn-dependent metalloprotease
MNKIDFARAYATKQIRRWCPDVKMVFGNFVEAEAAFGIAYLYNRRLGLDTKIIRAISREDITDLINHEVAHFVAFDRWGEKKHGRKWERACKLVGAKPTRFVNYDF